MELGIINNFSLGKNTFNKIEKIRTNIDENVQGTLVLLEDVYFY